GTAIAQALAGQPQAASFDLASMRKDVRTMIDQGAAQHYRMPVTEHTLKVFDAAVNAGLQGAGCTELPGWGLGGAGTRWRENRRARAAPAASSRGPGSQPGGGRPVHEGKWGCLFSKRSYSLSPRHANQECPCPSPASAVPCCASPAPWPCWA